MRILILLFLLFITIFLRSQNNDSIALIESFDEIYGVDATLFNGKLYNFVVAKNIKGNQYFLGEEFIDGSVTIKGVRFDNLELNYDIYNQQLLLRYKNEMGGNMILSISQAWLDEFCLGDLKFKLIKVMGNKKICQILGNDSLQVIYQWRRLLKVDKSKSYDFIFSKPKKESYVLINSNYKKYKNNRSFVSLFTEECQPVIKKYLKRTKINVKKGSDKEINILLTYIVDNKLK